MRKSALETFRDELRKWVKAHNEVKGFKTNADVLMSALLTRIGKEQLTHIGSGFRNGWLTTEKESGRGYFVRETDRPGTRGGQFVMINRGNGKADPCWELFVQLADYAWLRTVAQRHGQTVRLEDRHMDLTVRTGDQLILYVEHKRTKLLAHQLLIGMRKYGETGFGLDDPDNPPLIKAKYLVRDPAARPLYFGLSAVGFKQLFKIDYGENNRFHLVDDPRSFSAPLADHPAIGRTRVGWSPVDALATEVTRLCPEIWISVGSGKTAYNFYAAADDGDAVILGVSETGEVWTDVARLGRERATRLASALANDGIILDCGRMWTRWRTTDSRVDLAGIDCLKVAEAIRFAIDFERSASK